MFISEKENSIMSQVDHLSKLETPRHVEREVLTYL